MHSLVLVVAVVLGQAAPDPSIDIPDPAAVFPGGLPPAAEAPAPGSPKTPPALIDDDGNLVIPGLGGMKFMVNGDVIDGSGKKIYDSATNRWTEGAFTPAVVAEEAQLVLPELRLGDTFKQCVERFGQPEKGRDSYAFEVAPWTVSVAFHRDRAERVLYMRSIGKREAVTSAQLYAKVATPDPLFVAARVLSAGKRDWVGTGADARILRPTTSTIIADYKPTADELADEKTLILPEVSWRTTDGQFYCSLDFLLLDGVLTEKMTIWTRAHDQREKARRVEVSEQ